MVDLLLLGLHAQPVVLPWTQSYTPVQDEGGWDRTVNAPFECMVCVWRAWCGRVAGKKLTSRLLCPLALAVPDYLPWRGSWVWHEKTAFKALSCLSL